MRLLAVTMAVAVSLLAACNEISTKSGEIVVTGSNPQFSESVTLADVYAGQVFAAEHGQKSMLDCYRVANKMLSERSELNFGL